MSEPILSIILPIYNVENYLDRCVNSIIAQELDQSEYEVIFVDDGSTDNSGRLADALSEKFLNSRVIHKENGGLSSARNAGLDVVIGKYVFMIDSDDWIEPNTFSVVLDGLSSEPDIFKFNAIKKPSGEEYKSMVEAGEYDKNAILNNLLPMALEKTGAYLLSAWSHIYRNDFIKTNRLRFVSEREIGSEDYLFNIQALLVAEKVLVVNDILYDYDFREGSLTNRYRKGLFEQYVKLHTMIEEEINKKGQSSDLRSSISFSYVEKFINVCLRNECVIVKGHTFFDAWKNVHRMIRSNYYLQNAENYPYEKGKANRKIILTMFRFNIVLPVFFMMRR